MQKRCAHSLVELAGRLKARTPVVDSGPVPVKKGRWVMLPPVPAGPKSNGLLLCMQPKPVTAIAWLKQCCPQISQNDVETLFRSGQVKVNAGTSLASDSEELKIKRVNRKDTLAEGSVLCLPSRSLQSVNIQSKGKRLNTFPNMEENNSEMAKEEGSEGELLLMARSKC